MDALLVRRSEIEVSPLFPFTRGFGRIHADALIYTVGQFLPVRMPLRPLGCLPCRTFKAPVIQDILFKTCRRCSIYGDPQLMKATMRKTIRLPCFIVIPPFFG